MVKPNRLSISANDARLWFKMNRAISRCTVICRTSILPFWASSSIDLSTCIAAVSIDRIRPVPSQCGHRLLIDSLMLNRKRWRDISSSPKWLIDPIWTRARSLRMASFIRRSTACWLRLSSMSIKSTTISPDMSRNRNWRASSSAASRLVFSAVSSIFLSRVDLPEFTSTATKASVWLITR